MKIKSFVWIGQFQKISIPWTTDGFHVLTPCCLRKFQNALPPMPLEFHNREPPLPFRISRIFFGSTFLTNSNAYINKRTWIDASSRLWSSGARRQAILFSDKKNLPLVARLCELLCKSEFSLIKMNTTYGNFTPLCFLVLFWRLQSKITQIQTVKIFQRSSRCVLSYVM